MHQMDIYLRPTPSIDCDNILIKKTALKLVEHQSKIPDKAKSLFYFVRDTIIYNLYVPSDKIEYFKASRILEMREGFCIQKAVLLTALARAVGIPARIHLSSIRNHLTPAKLKELMRGNLFPTHGYNVSMADENVPLLAAKTSHFTDIFCLILCFLHLGFSTAAAQCGWFLCQ